MNAPTPHPSAPAPADVTLHHAHEKIISGEDLSRREAESSMERILTGQSNDAQIAGFLAALRMKGETVDELVGFAKVMRRHAAPIFPQGRKFAANEPLIDTCGTGGDTRSTFNISTAAAFVVAGAGVRVAKHGNRSISSRCGAADVLEALGIRMDLPPEAAGRAIEEIGVGFLYAPAVHTATRHAMNARRELRIRTAFNLLGPLTNPAGASSQLAGVFDESYVELLARALGELGVERAFVVHGNDGLDEITLTTETQVAELRNGEVRSYTLAPEDFAVPRAPIEALAGGDAQHNAQIIRRILDREHGPRRDIVVANASAALVAANSAKDFLDGVRQASHSIDSGAARAKLDTLIAFHRA
jgi:anthranilate phosphoribosyltransferase